MSEISRLIKSIENIEDDAHIGSGDWYGYLYEGKEEECEEPSECIGCVLTQALSTLSGMAIDMAGLEFEGDYAGTLHTYFNIKDSRLVSAIDRTLNEYDINYRKSEYVPGKIAKEFFLRRLKGKIEAMGMSYV